MNHDSTTPKNPPGSGLSSVGSLYQTTESDPLNAIAMPIIPPTQEWVVDTGISNLLAVISHVPTDISTHKHPHINKAGLSAKASSFAIPFLIVFTTSPPNKIAPRHSHITAITHACLIVSAFEPTDEANAFATSFAPIPNAA
jgi:hypothetical protein